jgi:hypothetical protein
VLLAMAGIIFVSTSVVTMASIFNSKRIDAGADFNDNKIDLRAGKTFARSWVNSLNNAKDRLKN